MASVCTNEMLEKFSYDMYTFINQIFGDQTVRKDIETFFPSSHGTLQTILVTEGEFSGTHHHIMIDKKGKTVCSSEGAQNLKKNVNDTLCQSYSLLAYFGIPWNKNRIKLQMDMIEVYRRLLENDEFVEKIKEYASTNVWLVDDDKDQPMPKIYSPVQVIREIRKTLNKWERYGYWFYIGNGKCPKKGGKRTRKK